MPPRHQSFALRRQIGAFAEQIGAQLRDGRLRHGSGGVGGKIVQSLRLLPRERGKGVAHLGGVGVDFSQGRLKTAVALPHGIQPARRKLSRADQFAHHALAFAVGLKTFFHDLPLFEQHLPLAVIRRHALRNQQPRLRAFVFDGALLPQRGFELVAVFAENIGRPLALQLQRFVADVHAVFAKQAVFQLRNQPRFVAAAQAVAVEKRAACVQTDFHAALRIRQPRPRFRLTQTRRHRRQIGRFCQSGVDQRVELRIV